MEMIYICYCRVWRLFRVQLPSMSGQRADVNADDRVLVVCDADEMMACASGIIIKVNESFG